MPPSMTQALQRDSLFAIPRLKAAEAAFEALHPVQNLRPEPMVAGVAVLFAALCHRVGLEPQEVHSLGLKILYADDPFSRTNDILQSLRDFAGIRIKGDETVGFS